MNGLIRKAGVFTLGALLLASMAVAGVPSSNNSTLPTGITLSGASTVGGSPDGVESSSSFAAKTFTIRDGNNVAVPNVAVVIDFSACTKFKICSVQTQSPTVTVNCAAATVSAVTNSLGQVTISVVGRYDTDPGVSPLPASPCPVSQAPCATVTSLGQPLGSLHLASYDDGASGVNPGDVSRVLADRVCYNGGASCAVPAPALFRRSDLDYNCTVDPADISLMLAALQDKNLTGSSAFSCSGPHCP